MADEQEIIARFLYTIEGADAVIAANKAIEQSAQELSASTGQAAQGMNEVGAAGSKAASGAGQAATSFSAIDKSAEGMGKNLDIAAGGIVEVGAASSKAAQGTEAVAGGMTEAGTAAGKAGESAREAGGGFGIMGMAMNAMMAIQLAQMVGQVIAALGKAHDAAVATAGAFTQLLGSEQKAQAELNLLASTYAAAAWGTQKIDNVAQHFLMMGEDTKTLEKEIERVGDALAAMGQSADKMQPVITQLHAIQSESKVTAEDINKLVDDGIPAWDALAAGMSNARGKLVTVQEAQKEVNAGAISGKEAYQDMMTGMMKYSGAAEQSSHSLGAEWQRLGENAARAFGPVIEALAKILEGINKILEKSASLGDVIRLIVQASMFVVTGGGQIPGYASGIIDSPVGHFGMVGEDGPELMYIPQGSSIFPSGTNPFGSGGNTTGGGVSMPSLNSMMGDLHLTVNVTHQISLDSRQLAEGTIPHIAPIVRALTGRRM